MLPETENNYGQESCAILCLHPLISSPPLLVIADSKGTLYHCVVLSKVEDDEALETASQISDWFSSLSEHILTLKVIKIGNYAFL